MTHPRSQIGSQRGRLADAYAECRRLAARHYENFPVASRLVPAQQRAALAVIYAFARCADDFADEPGVQGRLDAVAQWRTMLDRCFRGESDHPVFLALGDVVRRFSLDSEPFHKLLCAFESDVRVNRHPDFASLLSYCECSANPVGRLVLQLFGHRDRELFAFSDCICTALQLANFWQDVAIDLARDRIYLPQQELAHFGLSVADLEHLAASSGWANDGSGHGSGNGRIRGKVLPSWRALMSFQVRRTRELFERGASLPERVAPSLRLQLRLTWLGGMSILEGVERAGYDVFRRRPKLSKLDFLRLYLKARCGPVIQRRGGAVNEIGR